MPKYRKGEPARAAWTPLALYVRDVRLDRVPYRLEKLAKRYGHHELTYFVECAGRVKIGKAQDARDRIDALKIGMPYPPNVLAVVHSYIVSEAEAHEQWAHLRRHLEWFEATPELLAWIKGLKAKERVANRLADRILKRIKHFTEPDRPRGIPDRLWKQRHTEMHLGWARRVADAA